MTVHNFFSELETLHREIVDMGMQVRTNIHRAVRCLTERNADFAEQVFRDEALVNQAEVNIDDLATRLVVLNQPVASDMRLIIAALKINTDLERMGDLAVGIAQRALTLLDRSPITVPVATMSDMVEGMVERCITAFTAKDQDMARGVLTSDDEVDRQRNEISEELTKRMESDPQVVRTALAYLVI